MSGQSQPLREHKGLQWMCLMDKIQKKLLLCPTPFVNLRLFSTCRHSITGCHHTCLLNSRVSFESMFCLDHDLLLQIERRQIHGVGARTTFWNRMLNMWEDGQTAAVWLRELLQLNPAMNFPAVLLLVRSLTSSNFVMPDNARYRVSAPVRQQYLHTLESWRALS